MTFTPLGTSTPFRPQGSKRGSKLSAARKVALVILCSTTTALALLPRAGMFALVSSVQYHAFESVSLENTNTVKATSSQRSPTASSTSAFSCLLKHSPDGPSTRGVCISFLDDFLRRPSSIEGSWNLGGWSPEARKKGFEHVSLHLSYSPPRRDFAQVVRLMFASWKSLHLLNLEQS